MSPMSSRFALITCLLVSGCAAEAGSEGAEEQEVTATDEAALLSGFNAQFTGCVESVNVGLAPTANVSPLVPSEYTLEGAGYPVTTMVMRTARCNQIKVGADKRKGTIAQIGAAIISPDGTGFVNSYQLYYYTDDLPLALALLATGVLAQWVPNLDFDYKACGVGVPCSQHVEVKWPGNPRFDLNATVTEGGFDIGAFSAHWWYNSCDGKKVKMASSVTSLFPGEAQTTVTTDANGKLGQLFGSSTITFPILNQFNRFPAGTMIVTKN